jgi:glycine betaine/proline transport system permease protein
LDINQEGPSTKKITELVSIPLRVKQIVIVALLLYIGWDLSSQLGPEMPVMKYFFPKLYTWLFWIFVLGLAIDSIIRLKTSKSQLLAGAIFLVAVPLALSTEILPATFPVYAPGQDQHVIEGQRTQPVEYITIGSIRPGKTGNYIDASVLYLKRQFKSFFRAATNNLLKLMVPLKKGLEQMPMWLFTGVVALIAWRVSGYRVALISVVGLLFIAVFDLWIASMISITVVGTATFLSIALSIPAGILMSKSDRFESIMRPVLDLCQTMPSFVYLIPAIFFLGIGMVPAVMATIVYAIPPCIRLTNLGIRLVSPQLIETARAFGTTPWQLLIKVQLPLARPTIMAGVNQCVMMALAMVVLAALVGAGGLGADVYAGVQQLEFGRGLMGGIGIVILAIIIDRITQGFAKDPLADRNK